MLSITLHRAMLRILRAKLILAALTALIFAVTTHSALTDSNQLRFQFQGIINTNDPTFNQELGINNFGVIAGYFGSGAQGHTNKGYTVVPPYTNQLNFMNENFPARFRHRLPAQHPSVFARMV